MNRRSFLVLALASATRSSGQTAEAGPDYASVDPRQARAFPRDFGSHPDFRTEWWYVTGWLEDANAKSYGFQVTFFRNRPRVAENNASAFAARQLLFAHAALADPSIGLLKHDQRAAREGFGLAGADQATTHAWIDDWSLALVGGAYATRIAAREFDLDLRFAPVQSPLLHGEAGVSRKGPLPSQASGYYSVPQLAVTGTVRAAGVTKAVTGRAWLDHEWSSEYMAPEAVGWDWTGINLNDGGALMAFRMREKSGGTLWSGATLRDADGRTRTFDARDIEFVPTREWRSPRTGVAYPIEMTLAVGARRWSIVPLFDDQELDARASTGTIYWEGAVRARAAAQDVGRGYLELTGYGKPMAL